MIGDNKPSEFRVHGALIAVNFFWGVGNVVASIGLSSVNPVYFALIREILAAILLISTSVVVTRVWPWEGLPHWRVFVTLGFMVFVNQGCFTVGLKLTNAVTGAIW